MTFHAQRIYIYIASFLCVSPIVTYVHMYMYISLSITSLPLACVCPRNRKRIGLDTQMRHSEFQDTLRMQIFRVLKFFFLNCKPSLLITIMTLVAHYNISLVVWGLEYWYNPWFQNLSTLRLLALRKLINAELYFWF